MESMKRSFREKCFDSKEPFLAVYQTTRRRLDVLSVCPPVHIHLPILVIFVGDFFLYKMLTCRWHQMLWCGVILSLKPLISTNRPCIGNIIAKITNMLSCLPFLLSFRKSLMLHRLTLIHEIQYPQVSVHWLSLDSKVSTTSQAHAQMYPRA